MEQEILDWYKTVGHFLNVVAHTDPVAGKRFFELDDYTIWDLMGNLKRGNLGPHYDHITPYLPLADGGPPGQTTPSNLAPLCRTHHRMKTHTAWDYKRLDTGTYTWTAPTGHQHDIAPASRRPPDRRT